MSLIEEVRYGTRMLGKNPGWTALVVVTLALGIGANTAMFGIVQHVLRGKIRYQHSEELVVISRTNPAKAGQLTIATPASYFDWREQSVSFSDVAALSFANFNLSGIEVPERLQAGMATVNFFSMLGVQPWLGRNFTMEEAVSGKHYVVMISHAFWQRHFGGISDVIGQVLNLNGRPHSVIGVLPSSFHFEQPVGLDGWAAGWGDAEVWRPLPFSEEDRKNREAFWVLTVARLKHGVSAAQAQAELEIISKRVQQDHPNYLWGVNVTPWRERVVGHSRPSLLMLFGATVFVLLIACANIAHLLLARTSARQKEFAIRIALGAGWGKVARQLLCEGLLLAVIAGTLGLALASWGTNLAAHLAPVALPRLQTAHLDFRAFGFAALLCAAVTVVFVLIPLVRVFRINLDDSLREGSRSCSESLRRNPLRSALVVFQVAFAIVLLSGAGLLIRSFITLSRVDPGFKAEHIVALDVSFVDRRYVHPHKRIELIQKMVEAAKAVPGVDAAASIYGLPLGSMVNDAWTFSIEGAPRADRGRELRTAYRMASSGYFQMLRVPLKAGRDFSMHDKTNTQPVAIVNEAFVRQFLSNTDPIGRRVRVADAPEPWEIVGVVGNVTPDALDAPSPPELYRPHSQTCDWYASFVTRIRDDGPALREAIRKSINSVDPSCPIYNLRTLDSQIAQSLAPRRFMLSIIWLFAAIALGLAAVGVYGIMAYSVSRRTREMGIRLALGASKSAVLGLIFREGMTLVAGGILIGITLSLALSGVLTNQLFGVSASDPLTFSMVAILLTGVAAVACWLPASRAAKVDPILALRSE
ncbi:MAG: ABC transporter permease [Verrucomicrobiales bacterium]|nr:ABC transporter permease [Verrucomicrobiales bacterium]